jgi:YHS domain-containing protein
VPVDVPRWLFRALHRRSFSLVVSSLTGVSITFCPLFLYQLGHDRLPITDWRIVGCFLVTYLEPMVYIQLAAPADGFVLQRNLLAGQRVEPGEELYRIADLHRVWVMADAYENQLPLLRPGTAARITSGGAGAALVSRVGGAPPVFDRTSRTMKLRLEAGNPGLALKPGMFVDVEFDVTLPPTLAIPSDAIVDSGLRRIVFVDRGQGYFEPREVETGWRIGDRVEVLKGLAPGERIVVSGNFLLDSESRMKSAAAQAQAPAPMAPAAAQAAAPSTAAAPEAAAPTHRAAEHAVPARAKDPVCGMEVDPKEAASAGRTGRHEGRTYYFCSDECRKNFQADPAKYLRPAGGTPHD